jgi:hypothetical protein
MPQNRWQNVFIEELNFGRDHLDGLKGSIEDNDHVKLGDNDDLLRIGAHRGRPLNDAALDQRST